MQYAKDIDYKIQSGCLGFSTTPKAEHRDEVIERMMALFPDKSKFEI